MIPNDVISIDLTLDEEVETSLTYKTTKDTIQGYTDNIDALQQAIYKELSTEKYEHAIYDFDYGIELESLIGKDPIYVKIELKRRIQECLLKDERIETVDNFTFSTSGDSLLCSFDVVSIYGVIEITKEVNV